MTRPNFDKIKNWLKSLSFRTGVTVGIICIFCYGFSFAQMLLPISVTAKSILWTIFFGLAKATQYTAIIILGKTGIDRLKELRKSPPRC